MQRITELDNSELTCRAQQPWRQGCSSHGRPPQYQRAEWSPAASSVAVCKKSVGQPPELHSSASVKAHILIHDHSYYK